MGANPQLDHARSTNDLLAEARQGSRDAMGRILESCRTYLVLVANEELSRDLQAKLGPSDVVQDTFATAQRVFERFNGQSLEELLAWLRQILLNRISEERRRFLRSQCRSVTREARLFDAEVDHVPSPSGELPHGKLIALETAEQVSLAIATLSPEHQQVIQLRNWQLLPFETIGLRMNRTPGAARALWMRALQKLAELLESRDE